MSSLVISIIFNFSPVSAHMWQREIEERQTPIVRIQISLYETDQLGASKEDLALNSRMLTVAIPVNCSSTNDRISDSSES